MLRPLTHELVIAWQVPSVSVGRKRVSASSTKGYMIPGWKADEPRTMATVTRRVSK